MQYLPVPLQLQVMAKLSPKLCGCTSPLVSPHLCVTGGKIGSNTETILAIAAKMKSLMMLWLVIVCSAAKCCCLGSWLAACALYGKPFAPALGGVTRGYWVQNQKWQLCFLLLSQLINITFILHTFLTLSRLEWGSGLQC